MAQHWSHRQRRGGGDDRSNIKQRKCPNLGINYGLVANDLPPPKEVARLLEATRVSSIKIYSPNADVLRAFSNTDMSVVVGVPDESIPVLASSTDAAMLWITANIIPFFPATRIVSLVVGNEVLSKTSSDVSNHLVQAMENLYHALLFSNIQNVSVSTTHSMAVLETSYPPSASRFHPQIVPTMKRILSFLSSTSSSFMSNSYPYFAYKQNPELISLDYALFRPNPGFSDPNTNLHYSNLFDAQIDSIYSAIKALGYDNIPVVVAESGWPSHGDADEAGASLNNAEEYNRNLITHIASNAGTPASPNRPIRTYIFALFNENLKPGPTSERNFGLFQPDESEVYDVGLQISRPAAPPPTMDAVNLTNPRSPDSSSGSATWCIAKPSSSIELLEQILQFACQEGGADCMPIQPDGTCFNPNSLISHVSYAMNSYYQLHGRNFWNCEFNGAGMVTPSNPSYGNCVYPSQ
ncbi:hypothetical protein KP509_31G047300 [Ceratopteris richardii]|nr:hypothetical protein KP509_31G047300 [Ceratopteris richardii]